MNGRPKGWWNGCGSWCRCRDEKKRTEQEGRNDDHALGKDLHWLKQQFDIGLLIATQFVPLMNRAPGFRAYAPVDQSVHTQMFIERFPFNAITASHQCARLTLGLCRQQQAR